MICVKVWVLHQISEDRLVLRILDTLNDNPEDPNLLDAFCGSIRACDLNEKFKHTGQYDVTLKRAQRWSETYYTFDADISVATDRLGWPKHQNYAYEDNRPRCQYCRQLNPAHYNGDTCPTCRKDMREFAGIDQ